MSWYQVKNIQTRLVIIKYGGIVFGQFSRLWVILTLLYSGFCDFTNKGEFEETSAIYNRYHDAGSFLRLKCIKVLFAKVRKIPSLHF